MRHFIPVDAREPLEPDPSLDDAVASELAKLNAKARDELAERYAEPDGMPQPG